MFVGDVCDKGWDQPSPSPERLSAGRPLDGVNLSSDRQVSFAYRSSVARSSAVSALTLPVGDARRVGPDPSCSPSSNTPRTTKLSGEARLRTTPRRLLGWYGAPATMSRVQTFVPAAPKRAASYHFSITD